MRDESERSARSIRLNSSLHPSSFILILKLDAEQHGDTNLAACVLDDIEPRVELHRAKLYVFSGQAQSGCAAVVCEIPGDGAVMPGELALKADGYGGRQRAVAYLAKRKAGLQLRRA